MSRSRSAASLYLALGVVHIAALDNEWINWLTKPLLMPALALYAIAAQRERGARVSRRLLLALALAWAGDLTLQFDAADALTVGMLFFLVAYGIYAAEFIRSGAVGHLRRSPRWLIPIGYGVAVTAAMVWLWPGLSAEGVALPMAGYAALMAVMASTATAWGWRVGLGGGLLLLSDTLIGIGLADAAELPGRSALVMTTYLLGQLLVVTGWTTRAQHPHDQSVPEVVRTT